MGDMRLEFGMRQFASVKLFIDEMELLSNVPGTNYIKKISSQVGDYYILMPERAGALSTNEISDIAKRAFESLRDLHWGEKEVDCEERRRLLQFLSCSLENYGIRFEASARRHWWGRVLLALGFQSFFGKSLVKPKEIGDLKEEIDSFLEHAL